jgi:hypothetical protein
MAYYITTTQGAPIATVQDATINTAALSITLIGRDYAGYGAFLNENFVHILENFAANTAPNGALTGQLWYDTSTNILNVWNTSLNKWKPISSSISAAVAPTAVTSTVGDLWWNNSLNQLNVYSGATNGWILIGPPDTSTGSGAVVATILDSSSVSHTVVELKTNNVIIAIISGDAVFTPQTAINGFTTIVPGLNLVNTSALSGSQFTGAASNALTLNGVTSNQFLSSDQNATTQYQKTAGGGLVVASDLSLSLDTANNRVVVNTIQNNRDLNFYVNQSGANVAAIAISASTGTVTINDDAVITGALTTYGAFVANTTTTLVGITTLRAPIVPALNGSIDIGATGTRFNDVYATTLYGNLIGGLTSVSTFTVSGATTLSSTLAVSGVSTFAGNIVANGVTAVNGNITVNNGYVPTANTSVGTKGQITYDSGYVYICVATNTWKRATLAAW